MTSRRRLIAIAVLAACAALPVPGARAEFFQGEVIDGPSADIQSVGDVDLARDGAGAAVYVRKDGGEDHIFVSQFVNGSFTVPVRVDPGLSGPSSQPVVAASDGGRVVIVFVNSGGVWSVVRPEGAPGWPPPTVIWGSSPASNPALDMSIDGHAYAVFTAQSGKQSDVRAARLEGSTWTNLDAPLDIDPGTEAGTDTGAPKVAVAADNTAVATWGELTGGKSHVYARRLFVGPAGGPVSSAYPQEAGGADSDQPDIQIEDDSSFAWVVYRTKLEDGNQHAFARRLVGSLFDPAVEIDALPYGAGESSELPRIDMDGVGEGLAVSGRAGSFQTVGAVLRLDAFSPGVRLDSAGSASAPFAVPAVGENFQGLVAWQRDAGDGNRDVRARSFEEPASFGPETILSQPGLGFPDAALGIDAAADRAGDAIVVFIQGPPGDRRVMGAGFDRAPPRPLITLGERSWHGNPLTWSSAPELWGPTTYTVFIDGKAVGTSPTNKFAVPRKVRDGRHRWAVGATDRRGQSTVSKTRRIRLDRRKPTLNVKISGARKRGSALRISARAHDRRSGVRGYRISFGGRGTVERNHATHVFRGRHATVTVSARDRAGNVAVKRIRLTLK